VDGSRLAVWGGIECSLVRVGDRCVDEIRATGHQDRIDDLDRVAGLGIKVLRYPLLWERVAPEGLRLADWSWTDERLNRMRDLGITPIITLVHHGSGPPSATLSDETFPQKLAEFAGAVARRYPWLRHFTPVNEPLTTARFSALYGIWYPHGRSDVSFLRALFLQVEAIAAAMQAIHEHIPDAQLVTTEDLGKTYSTTPLAYQANFDNARRWLALDLLNGRMHENGLMHRHLRKLGHPADRASLRRYYSPPDVAGFNYYVTSERYLDHRVENFPQSEVGGNGRDRYVDLEAVRTERGIAGAGALLREAAERYPDTPLAITECHIDCTRDEQLRWLEETYQASSALLREGVDVRAMTVWSLFGAYDWDSLLTRDAGHYEVGCFDARQDPPAETALADWVRARVAGVALDHPALDAPGWWAPSSDGLRSRRVAVLGCGDAASLVADLCRLRSLAPLIVDDGILPALFETTIRRQRVWLVVDTCGHASPELKSVASRTAAQFVRIGEPAAPYAVHQAIDAAIDAEAHGRANRRTTLARGQRSA
jgi:dTDP-4-dehydrorhamnose reductase